MKHNKKDLPIVLIHYIFITMTITWKPILQKGHKPLYQGIIEAIESDIKSGQLPVGTRMPTHRELAERLNIALGTVTRAYNEVLKRGLLRSRGRQGTFVNDPLNNNSSFARLLMSDSASINLSVNYPCSSQDPDLASALKKIASRPGCRNLLQYTPAAGLSHHRLAAVNWLSEMGAKFEEEAVILTSGAQNALMITLSAIAKTGDTILVDEFTYPGIKILADMLGLKLLGISGDQDGLIPEELDAICRQHPVTALYCIPTLQNPTSSILSTSRRRSIIELAQKHRFLVIEDEINRRLVSNPPPLMSSLDPGCCILISSASKVLASGLRAGFIVSPPDYRQGLLTMLGASTLMVSPLSFEIFTEWVNDGTAEQIIANRIRDARERQKLASDILGDFNLSAYPTSYFAWLQLPEDWSSSRFAMAAYRRGVSIAPADLFAVGKHGRYNAARICLCAAADMNKLEKALKILAGILKGNLLSPTITV